MQGFKGRWVSAQRLARKSGSKGLMILVTQKETDMNAHFRPGEFLTLKFTQDELFIGYDVLSKMYVKNPTPDLARMMEAMEKHLFPKPKLILIANIHICEKCFCELDVRKDSYHVRTNEHGVITWTHQNCPQLKSDKERER